MCLWIWCRRRWRIRRSESELVIIVTPYVVRPVEPGQIASPTDGLLPPSDVERIVQGQTYKPHLEKRKGTPTGRGATGLVGPTGFVLN